MKLPKKMDFRVLQVVTINNQFNKKNYEGNFNSLGKGTIRNE